ncbi:PREDICTED: GTP cyclohydrolase 1 feedback regulatory protein [Corvus brachyrhynchos]|nr:PREDICTED: GTP cyclohydrolase 1 feedback regulatory protein [Corvus brachyrhynchos]
MKPQSKRYPPALAAPTSCTHILQDAGGAHSHVFIWGFPFPDSHPPPKAWICWCSLGQETGTVKPANEQSEGVVMDTATAATGDVPKEAAVDWEWERVGMLQHQSSCWQQHWGSYKLVERLRIRYRKGHLHYGTGGSSLEQQGSRRLWKLCSLLKGQSKHFQPETWHRAQAGNRALSWQWPLPGWADGNSLPSGLSLELCWEQGVAPRVTHRSVPVPQEVGPTMVGDEHSDPHLMSILGATKRSTLGNNFCEYYVNDAPRVVLDKLESLGYRVVSMTGVGQTLVWCLHRE